jgi:hypothetical protein
MSDWLNLSMGALAPSANGWAHDPLLVRLHVVADAVAAGALFVIPALLVFLVLRRRDLPFPSLFVLLGVFLLILATQHLLRVWTWWEPDPWTEGLLKALGAILGLSTLGGIADDHPRGLADAGARRPATTQRRTRRTGAGADG